MWKRIRVEESEQSEDCLWEGQAMLSGRQGKKMMG